MQVLKSDAEIVKMRRSGKLLASILREMERMVAPGITTRELGDRAARMIRDAGAQPLFLNYPNPMGRSYPAFPSVICASRNEQVVHGIPNDAPLVEGDIISIDCGVKLEGYVADAAVTIPVGEVTAEIQALIDVTRASLEEGIAACRDGNRIGDIGHAVERYVKPHGYGIVRDFCGHGVGTNLHEEPQVPNYGRPGTGSRLRPGLCLALEPMINLGTWRVATGDDTWTVCTADGLPSAHFEHSIAVTDGEPIVLTAD